MLTRQNCTISYKCPTCSAPLWSLKEDGTTDIHADLLGGDGDVIPGSPTMIQNYACAPMAYVQACPFCQGRYWTLDLCLHGAGQEALLNMMAWGVDPIDGLATYTFRDSRQSLATMKLALTDESVTHHTQGIGIFIEAGPYAFGGLDASPGRGFWEMAKARFETELPGIESAIMQVKAELLSQN